MTLEAFKYSADEVLRTGREVEIRALRADCPSRASSRYGKASPLVRLQSTAVRSSLAPANRTPTWNASLCAKLSLVTPGVAASGERPGERSAQLRGKLCAGNLAAVRAGAIIERFSVSHPRTQHTQRDLAVAVISKPRCPGWLSLAIHSPI